jgi:2-oxo-4-hydroxy-4-carboxy-5-ureidoimidazoline decarboxylase
MGIGRFNSLDSKEALSDLLDCCHCVKWAELVVARRPFITPQELLEYQEKVWFSLPPEEWLEAFKAHPKIGNIESLRSRFAATKEVSRAEQKGVQGASEKILEELAFFNNKYESKFGFIFIVFATGKSADEMLEILKTRISNTREEELQNAAVEQNKITRLRLEKIL